MIALLLTDVPFEQDIRELFMAFYPDEEFVYSGKSDITLTASCNNGCFDFNIEIGSERKQFGFSEGTDRFETKCELKRQLYSCLSSINGKELPWGTLTGIRPTKLMLDRLFDGAGIEEVREIFKKDFYVSDEKIELGGRIALTEKSLLEKTDYEKGWSLYIGIPFCPTRCLYCSFTAYPISLWDSRTAEYVDAVCKEIRQVCRENRGKILQTVYIGGGTPTSIDGDSLARIIRTVYESADTDGLIEFTVEAGRPDSITAYKLEKLREEKVTRISINPQTMNQKTLDLIGRKHKTEDVIRQFELARSMGFDNINMDIIVGLPGENVSDVERTMEIIGSLKPDSVTVHSLAIKRASRLITENFNYKKQNFEDICGMLKVAANYCEKMSLQPYYMYRQKNMAGNFENVGYSFPGKECIYNILIMEERQSIYGCGAGTSTKIALGPHKGVKRYDHPKDPSIYIERIKNGTD